ncbi:4Fe-4S dicluster domain-containing protein [Methanocaldococcus sp.]
MKKIMMTNFTCDNCGDCVKACMQVNKVARIGIMKKEDRYLPIVCQHCRKAPCKEVCPVEAIEFKDDFVYLDEEKCIGCGLCALACPFGAITMQDVAYKCILCNGEEPACVKACSKRCLELVDVNELTFIKRDKTLDLMYKMGKSDKKIIDKIVSEAKLNKLVG